MTLDLVLAEATRCLIACRPAQGGLWLVALPCWSDGEALWLVGAGSDPVIDALASAPNCAAWIGPIGQEAGLAATGLARVFDAQDPIGLLVHGPVIALAVAALAAHHPREVARSWLPSSLPAAVRVALSELRAVEHSPAGPGMAPVLPEAVPADIRRRLSGRRDVVVAGASTAGVRVERATWSAGYVLNGELPASPGAPIAVAVGAGAVGVSLSGELGARGALQPAQVSWWSGPRSGTAALSTPPRGALELPD